MATAREYASRLDQLAAAIVETEREAAGRGGKPAAYQRQRVIGMGYAYAIMADIEDIPEALAEARGIGSLLLDEESPLATPHT